MMDDLDIIRQLMAGNHLSPKELDRASVLINGLKKNIDGRIE